MELVRLRAVLWKWLWFILAGTALVAASTFIVSVLSVPIYRATASVMVEQTLPDPGGEYSAILTSQSLVKTYAQLIKSPAVLDQVIGALGLGMGTDQLASMIGANPIRDTQIIEVAVEDSNALRARQIVNRVAETFVQYNAQSRQARFDVARRDLEQQIATLEKQIAATQVSIASLSTSSASRSSVVPEMARLEIVRLESSLSRDEARLAVLLRSAEDFRLAGARYASNVILLSPAEVPLSPVRPRVLFNTVVALVIGFGLSVALALLLEYLDDTVKGAEEVTQVLGLSTLGAVGRIQGASEQERLVALAAPRSPFSEAYRSLRTSLQFVALDRPLATVLVASTNPQEGKSLTVANLGIVMAQAGLRVIIVDSDLRRPSLHRLFGLGNGVGLTNLLLADNFAADGVIQPTRVDNLRVVTSGPLPPNPSELLGSQRAKRLLEWLKTQADVVILDSPPCLAVTDASVLAGIADGVVFLVDTATRRGAAQRGVAELSRVGANILGVVLNKMSARASSYYYYYYYAADGDRQRRRRRLARRLIPSRRLVIAIAAALVVGLSGAYFGWLLLSGQGPSLPFWGQLVALVQGL